MNEEGPEFDFIIVGAGSAGCVLGERLSRQPNTRVLLVEAGPENRSHLLRVPAALPLLLRGKRFNWAFETVAQPPLENRRLYWPRGKVVGGSSSINAMCAVRGPVRDFKSWAKVAGDPWAWSQLQPLFEQLRAPTDSSPGLPFAKQTYRHPLSKSFVEAAQQAGLPESLGFNQPDPEGAGFYEVYQRGGERYENARAFLDPVRRRSNLTVWSEAQAFRIELDENRKARALWIRCASELVRVRAHREIILTAGTIGSPHLLLLSGIGPAMTLKAFGIPVLHSLESVGANLTDHLDVSLVYRTRGGGTTLHPRDWNRSLSSPLRYAAREGPLTSNLAEAGAFARSQPHAMHPDLQLHFLPAIQERHGRRLVNTLLRPGMTLHVCLLYPQSRGRISLASSDPFAAPLIDPRYLSAPQDRQPLAAGLQLLLNIVEQPALQAWDPKPHSFRKPLNSAADLDEYICSHGETIYHPTGTCRMGCDADAVVDDHLRVNGVHSLRVADASVFPTPIGANTNFAASLIGARAAELIAGDYGEH